MSSKNSSFSVGFGASSCVGTAMFAGSSSSGITCVGASMTTCWVTGSSLMTTVQASSSPRGGSVRCGGADAVSAGAAPPSSRRGCRAAASGTAAASSSPPAGTSASGSSLRAGNASVPPRFLFHPVFGSVSFRPPHADLNAAAASLAPGPARDLPAGRAIAGTPVNGDARSAAAASGPEPAAGASGAASSFAARAARRACVRVRDGLRHSHGSGPEPSSASTSAAAAARCSSVGTSLALALALSCSAALDPGTGRGLKSFEYMSSANGSGTKSRKSPSFVMCGVSAPKETLSEFCVHTARTNAA
mmetsp:Transcript_4830/g.21848  ORF Transcript_4830/g.21848 Transcript_4830/m.21848 type:complete len:304 (-) Transcript_4830:1232-2143(-)